MQDALRLHMRVCVYGGTAASDLSPLSKSWRGSCSAVRSRLGTVATAGTPHTHGLPARMTSRRASSRSALELPWGDVSPASSEVVTSGVGREGAARQPALASPSS